MQQLKNRKKMTGKKTSTRYGDTIVEAVLAIAIYSVVAVLALGAMNSGLKTAQKNLEGTMSRAAIDSQVDTLRYIYENYLVATTKGGKDSEFYGNIWDTLRGRVTTIDSSHTLEDTISKLGSGGCEEMLNNDKNKGAFALNPRALLSMDATHGDLGVLAGAKFKSTDPDTIINGELIVSKTYNKLTTTPLYPRITYEPEGSNDEYDNILIGYKENATDNTKQPSRRVKNAEGIWIVGVIAKNGKKDASSGFGNSYDFYVRSCWNAAGEKKPSTFTTVVRLYKVD